ncbi:MAG: hypothetical protein KJP04_01325, partial [Arenicella sp.]|nr:hypothetical protein [Arenicella sp.]
MSFSMDYAQTINRQELDLIKTEQCATHCVKSFIFVTGMIAVLLTVPNALAQSAATDSQKRKLAAVMNIINIFLLDAEYVTGHLYIDTNGNGSQDIGEPNLADVDVLITDRFGNEQTVATDANGDWIAAVPAGSTKADVDETDPQYPVSHTQTEGTDPTVVVESSATTDAGNDGYQPPEGTVMHHIYEDTNGNATQDLGEPDMPGVQVDITDSAGTVVTVVTDANGDIPPTSVPVGETVLDIVDSSLPPNIGQTEGSDPTVVVVESSVTTHAGNDGYQPPEGTVMYHIYEDTNGNATQDLGEPDLPGVQVEITDSAGTVVTVVTDTNGDIPPTSVPAGETVLDIVDSSLPSNIGQTEGTDPTTVSVPSSGATGDVDGYRPPPYGIAIPLSINELSNDIFQATLGDAVFGQFDLQDEGVEFCFDLASNMPLSSGDILVEVNGEAVIALEGNDNCYQIPQYLQRDINYVAIQVLNPAVTLTITRVELAASVQTKLGLVKLTRGGWDEAA